MGSGHRESPQQAPVNQGEPKDLGSPTLVPRPRTSPRRTGTGQGRRPPYHRAPCQEEFRLEKRVASATCVTHQDSEHAAQTENLPKVLVTIEPTVSSRRAERRPRVLSGFSPCVCLLHLVLKNTVTHMQVDLFFFQSRLQIRLPPAIPELHEV